MTIFPASSAGWMTSRTFCARAVEYRSTCASGLSAISCAWSTISRIRSPAAVPPGSRVSTTARPRCASASVSSFAWTDLPEPSPPSNEMKSPRVTWLAPLAGFVRASASAAAAADRPHSSVDLHAADGVVPGGARREAGALGELVLQAARVGVLRRELDLVLLSVGHGLDGLARLIERVVLGRAAQLGDRRERGRDLAGGVAARDVDRDAARLGVAQARRLAPVVVLQRDDDVGVLGLAHHGDRHPQAAACLFHARPGHAEG